MICFLPSCVLSVPFFSTVATSLLPALPYCSTQILADEELRAMLVDPELQRVLVECGDPARFQHHMRDPDTRRKIMRLQQAGLVGTAR
jgi:hypothetical protein